MAKKNDEKPQSKTQFIRDRPNKTPAEIAEEADLLGVVITPEYVSSVRSAERARAAALEGTTGRRKRKVRESNGHVNGVSQVAIATPDAKTPEAKTLDDLLDFVLMVKGSEYVQKYVNAKCDPSAFAHILSAT